MTIPVRNSDTADPFDTEQIRARVMDAWRATPARFREDANTEEDFALGGYRDRLLVELLQNASDAAGAAVDDDPRRPAALHQLPEIAGHDQGHDGRLLLGPAAAPDLDPGLPGTLAEMVGQVQQALGQRG